MQGRKRPCRRTAPRLGFGRTSAAARGVPLGWARPPLGCSIRP